MKKILITGFAGFVARHFLDFLYNNKYSFHILGVDMNAPQFGIQKYNSVLDIKYTQVNMLDDLKIQHIISDFQPEYILHLASYSSVSHSWQHPNICFDNNMKIFLNLVEAVRKEGIYCKILSVGSSEEYGDVKQSEMPLVEDMITKPVNPYAVARTAQEMMSKVYVDGYGMDIVMTRSFNHIGPFQDERFVVPSFVKKIMEIKQKGMNKGKIECGDLSIVRDFVDVRDVVRAYYMLLRDGIPGEIYNVCSGKGVRLAHIVDVISHELCVEVECVINPEFVRPNDNHIVIGSYKKINDQFGWKPDISLEVTLRDMILN